MDPTALTLTLTTNYDNHTITLYDIDPLHLETLKGTPIGPIYNANIIFQGVITGPVHNDNLNFRFQYAISGTKLLFDGEFGNNMANYITLIISYDEPIDLSEWKMKISMPGELSGMLFDDMETCVFSEVMPMKGVHDG